MLIKEVLCFVCLFFLKSILFFIFVSVQLFCKILVYSFLLLLSRFSLADKVETPVAAEAGKVFFLERLKSIKPVSENTVYVTDTFEITDSGRPLFYIFNFSCGGFVLVSASDNAFPILGYSFEGKYDPEDLPENYNAWMNTCSGQIKDIIDKGIPASKEISSLWSELKSHDYHFPENKEVKSVLPLLTSKWGQGEFYNELCPLASGGPGGHAAAGCVALAMAQVIYYYKFPLTGKGTKIDYCLSIDNCEVNFDSTFYFWYDMRDSLLSFNHSLAELIFDCGVSVNTCYTANGSSASFWDCQAAFQDNFKYFGNSEYIQKTNYSDSLWEQKIVENLDKKIPVLYNGMDTALGVAHAFVCDGYQSENFFHFNWGWNGSCDGYFYVQNLNPAYNLSYAQSALINICPDTISFPFSCSVEPVFTNESGTFDDGSSNIYNYNGNSDCEWKILRDHQNVKIQLEFLSFDIEAENDKLLIYDGFDKNAPLLAEFSGSALPPIINSSGNSLCMRFISNDTINKPGWIVKYSTIYPEHSQDTTYYLYEKTDAFDDGSGDYFYYNDMDVKWIINPPNVNNISINFDSVDIENELDFIYIYDLNNPSPLLLKIISGKWNIVDCDFESDKIMVNFKTNYGNQYQGWKAYYTSFFKFDKEIGLYNFICFPNPATDELTIHFDFSIEKDATLKISDVFGLTYYYEEFTDYTGICNRQIDVSDFGKGVYILQLITDREVLKSKFEKI